MIYHTFYHSPVGMLKIEGTEEAITAVDFIDAPHPDPLLKQETEISFPKVIVQCVQELDEYFQGKRTIFTVPLSPKGTSFQTSVWNTLKTIDYGKTNSYWDIATKIGNVKAVRAVGMTNGKNPIAILVPCHRVVGKNGKMVGYAFGIWRKEWLLQHEQRTIKNYK